MGKYDFKMTPKEFMSKVIELYETARQPKFYHPHVKRGRSHAIPAVLEDLFAAFLAFNITEDFEYLVDPPVTINQKTTYPDIMMVRNALVKNIIEIKVDIGWQRGEFTDNCQNLNTKISNIAGKTGRMRMGDIKFSKRVKCHVVIISDLNITKKVFDEHIKAVNKFSHLQIYSLSSGTHPNAAGANIESIDIKEEEFKRLMDNLTR